MKGLLIETPLCVTYPLYLSSMRCSLINSIDSLLYIYIVLLLYMTLKNKKGWVAHTNTTSTRDYQFRIKQTVLMGKHWHTHTHTHTNTGCHMDTPRAPTCRFTNPTCLSCQAAKFRNPIKTKSYSSKFNNSHSFLINKRVYLCRVEPTSSRCLSIWIYLVFLANNYYDQTNKFQTVEQQLTHVVYIFPFWHCLVL